MLELPYCKYQLEHLIINCNDMTIANQDKVIKLPVKVFEFFKLFLKAENQTVDRAVAIDTLWQGNYPVGKRGYINAMWHIRKVFVELGVNSDDYFKTLPKVGYKLVCSPIAIPENTLTESHSKPIDTVKFLDIADWIETVGNNLKLSSFVLALSLLIILISFSVFVVNYFSINAAIEPLVSNPTKITNFEGIEEHPTISPDGHYMAFEWVQKHNKGKLYIKDLVDKSVPLRLVTGAAYKETSPSWSPSNHSLAYFRLTSEGQCQVRIRQLITNQDRLIDTGCSYLAYENGLDWSPNGKYLVFSKKIEHGVGLFKYDLEQQSSKQISFPQNNEHDIRAAFSADSNRIAFVRQYADTADIILLNEDGMENTLIANELSVTGLLWQHQENQIYTNILEGGEYLTYAINPTNKAKNLVHRLNTPSNLSFNYHTSELYFSRHLSQEYISQHSFIEHREIRRVSSSSRDLYGQYVANSEAILFVSNRDNNWDLWLNTATESINLTHGIGAVTTYRVSPTGKQFIASVKSKTSEHSTLYLGKLPTGELTPLDLGNLSARYISWSLTGDALLFSSQDKGKAGIFKFEFSNQNITQLTFSNEIFAIEGSDGNLYMSREGERGIWQFNQDSLVNQLYIKDLDETDFGSYFWQNDSIYYLSRNKDHDLIKRQPITGSEQVISSFPAGTVRKYYGLAPADQQSFILTLNSINDSDIYSLPTIGGTTDD